MLMQCDTDDPSFAIAVAGKRNCHRSSRRWKAPGYTTRLVDVTWN